MCFLSNIYKLNRISLLVCSDIIPAYIPFYNSIFLIDIMPLRNIPPKTQFVNLERIPSVFQSQMNNGITCSLLPLTDTQHVRIDFLFNGGTWVQSIPLQAMMTFQLIKEGTATRTAQQINEELDFYGATISANVCKTYAFITVICLRKFLSPVMQLVYDFLLHPAFDTDAYNLTIQQLWANYQIKMDRVRPQAERLFYETLFGRQNPMASFEYPEHFSQLSIDILRDYHKKCVNAANCRMFITGGYNDEDVTLINDIFGTENWGNCQFLLNISPVGYPADPLGQLQKQTDENVVIDRNRNIIKLIMRKPTVQSALFAGCVMPKLEPEERAYLALANMMFGGFFGSRLMTNIREDKGYTYGIHSSLQQQLFFNLFSIQTETANQFVNKVVEEVNNEINRIISLTPSDEELDIVKKYFSGNICRTYEANLSFTGLLIRKTALGDDYRDVVKSMKLIRKAKPHHITDVMRRFLNPNNVVWCVAGADF